MGGVEVEERRRQVRRAAVPGHGPRGPRQLRRAEPHHDARGHGRRAVWKSKFYGAFVLNHRVVLRAIDATPARWRDDAGSLPLDGASTAASSPRNDLVRPKHWLISTQAASCGGT